MVLFLIFTIGIIFGSFLNVIILRTPSKAFSFQKQRSHCLKCNSKLHWYHNLPILSWLFLKGKCYFCNTPISIQYPLIEFISGVLFLTSYISYTNFDFFFFKNIYFYLVSLILLILLYLSVHDIKYKYVYLNHIFVLFGFSFVLGLLNYEYIYYHFLFLVPILLLKFIFDNIKGEITLGTGDLVPLFTLSVLTINYENYLFEVLFSLWIMSISVVLVSKIFSIKRTPLIPFILASIFIKSLFLLLFPHFLLQFQ